MFTEEFKPRKVSRRTKVFSLMTFKENIDEEERRERLNLNEIWISFKKDDSERFQNIFEKKYYQDLGGEG